MKKFLLLAFATLLVSPCVSETAIKSSNNNNLTGNNNDSIVSEQSEDTYTIRFLNDEGTEISSNQYKFGEEPEEPAATPEKENPSPLYTYTFSGWSPSIALVTEDADYVATYEVEAKNGEVKWVDGDGKTLLTDTYAYGSMPYYHGDIPTKTATDTETYVFKGWSPEISLVSKESTIYVAQFSPIYAKYSIQINCTDCLVNKKKNINEEHNVLSDLTYQFNTTSKETCHYPYKLEVTVDGIVTNDYAYDNITGKLNIKLKGNTVINAVADNSCVLMKYKYSTDYPTVKITCDGDFERVDWGDGTSIDATSMSHTYSHNPDIDQYDIRIFGKLNSIGTTSKAVTKVGIFYGVTFIDGGAFSNCSSLTSITIPNSVTIIGYCAFQYCSSLTSITIPNSVTSIGSSAFRGCSSLTSITIPNSVTLIEYEAFCGCSSLSSIVIPDSITSIAHETFFNCSSLTSINIPNSITSIGYEAFAYCSSLTSITIPNSVTSIEHDTFSGCSSLTSINIPDSVTSIGYEAFAYCSSLSSITIPDGVTSIEHKTFYNCSSLTSINIPNSVTSIGEYAFYNCTALTSINIQGSITSIGNYAFYECSSLTSITIPNSVTSIGEYTFRGCSSLSSITIPNSVTSIGSKAFYFCSSLTIYCEAESKPSGWNSDWNYNDRPVIWGYVENGEYNNFKYGVSLIGGKKSIVIIGLVDRSVTSATIPSTIDVSGVDVAVTTIGSRAFSDCSKLTSIAIPNSVTSIGSYAFSYCSSVELLDLSICDHVVSADSDFLYKTKDTLQIKVKASLVDQYKVADNWSAYENKIIGV